MATAGERYSERTGNIWSYAHRQDMTGLRAAVQRGVDVNIPNTVGWTPAIAAAAGGKTKALRYLGKEGADLTLADRGGNTASHHAARNGHAHALRALRELGCDITKVRLSQARGKEVRDVLIEAYNRVGKRVKEGGDGWCDSIDEEEKKVVGYERKQSKSTAFWGPRRTPISTKIKKKIIKDKRKVKKNKMLQREDEDTKELATSTEITKDETNEEQIIIEDVLSYNETVQSIKKNLSKKQKRRQQKKTKQQEEAVASEASTSIKKILTVEGFREEVETYDSIEAPLESSFAALIDIDSDSCDTSTASS